VSCPAPYTNKPILGLDVLTGLKHVGNNSFAQGKLLDPLSGNLYNTKAKLSKAPIFEAGVYIPPIPRDHFAL